MFAGLRKQSKASASNSNQEDFAQQPEPETDHTNTQSQQPLAEMDQVVTDLDTIEIQDRSRDYRYISERQSIYCLPPRRMIALYDYDPVMSSPNADSEVGGDLSLICFQVEIL